MLVIFLRMFCVSGLLFGTYRALLTLLDGGSAGEAIGTFVSAGLFFGLFMGVAITALHWWRVKQAGLDPATVSADVDVRERIRLPLPVDQALELCRSAVRRVPGASDIRVNAAAATVEARVGMTLMNLGQRIECRVTPAGGTAEVSIRSRPSLRTAIIDYGKNHENVHRIRTQLLAHAHVPAAPQG
ncbi:MAG TPA: hypothetical protein VF006_06970 [Longimicrobium sp.]